MRKLFLEVTSPKGFSAFKCDVGNWMFSKYSKKFEFLLGIFLDFLRNFLGIFLEFFGGFFGRNFFGEIYGWIFLEDFFGRNFLEGIFWKEFFGRNSYIVK